MTTTFKDLNFERTSTENVDEWIKEKFQCIEDNARPYTRHLVMRRTDVAPGLYETQDGPFMVADHDGVNYLMLWYDDLSDVEIKHDDIVLMGVYPSNISQDFEESIGVEVTEMKLGGL